jgi:predicted esterase
MTKHIAWSLLFCFLVNATGMMAQEAYHFTSGLVAFVPGHYGREAIYTDELSYRLYTQQMQRPVSGGLFTTGSNGQAVTWQALVADSTGRLVRKERLNGNRPGGRQGPWIIPGGGSGGLGMGTAYTYLTYLSVKAQVALLNIKGNSAVYVNGVLHTGDPYASGYLSLPVPLKKGLNELYVRGGSVVASLQFSQKKVLLNTADLTLPDIVPGGENGWLMGAVVVVNTTENRINGLVLASNLFDSLSTIYIPPIPPLSTRKVLFPINGAAVKAKGKFDCRLTLSENGIQLDEANIVIESVAASTQYAATFVSEIDGSLQYYGVTPQSPATSGNAALFLSVHGAGVEAIGQARAYQSKDWGTLVAATNRRPRGFNWEDWGRLDALEVLALAKKKFNPDPQRIYLTGHSMGGHGTWFLGATYPDQWAAIGACSGYPTLKGYGSADGLVPDSSTSALEQMLLRAGNQSDVIKLASNYKATGVYILHGDDDEVVPVKYARQMRKVLGEFQPDMSYYEYPGGGHWFGNQSVDWKPLFDFFRWHTRAADSTIDHIDFTTSNPGISASFRWAAIYQQEHPLQYSHMQLMRQKEKGIISGRTENIHLLQLQCTDWGSHAGLFIVLDGSDTIRYTTVTASDTIFLIKQSNKWILANRPGLGAKGPHRYGTFKDAFNHRMLFVYGTAGTTEENAWSIQKARYDAETWYYRGNGAVDLISDQEFAVADYSGRGIVLYGNASTNRAWNGLLKDCPIQVSRNGIQAGHQSWKGDSLAAYFVWPLKNSSVASVSVVSGTGLKGMNAANANQYFAGASGFPDFMIFDLSMLQKGSKGIKLAGFYNNNWELVADEFVKE